MIWLLLFSLRAFAREETLSAIRVIGGEAQELVKPSSSHYISKEKLTKHQDTDMNRIVKQVPGVYVREEDGFGLRPNIGIRGTNPDRSKKVNFMEDGILTGPAPYSAPAAYYTPSMMHVEGVEVFKGVATVPFGPNSVGGSINFLTPEPRGDRHGFVDAAGGTFDYRRILGRVETAGDVYSGLFQGAYHETSGFKELPGNQNTGFEQSDFLAKGRVRLKGGDRPQFLDVKIGFATENSHETYLGISENDFRDGPYQRYQASQLDHMKWRHETYVAAYTVALSANSTLTVNAYNLNFHRNWYRFDGFASGLSVRDVLNDPETYADEYQILKGEVDSDTLGGGGGQLRVVRNRRDFYSRGAEAHHMLSLDRHEIHWGLRVHEDQIRRAHGRDIYGMTGGQMVNSGMDRVTSEKDRDTSWSKSVFAKDEINLDPVRVTLAARYERVSTESRTFIVNDADVVSKVENEDDFFVPGVGAVWALSPTFSLLTGVNKGYAPSGPGQSDNVKPEESTNGELGFRYMKQFFAEAIGFYSDYKNIKGLCSFSAGCTGGTEETEFNGGEATVYGVESRVRFDGHWSGYKFPFELGYTFTSATFDTEFQTASPEWGVGVIKKGAPLPYVPKNQYVLGLGLGKGKFTSDVRFSWTGRQYDQAAEKGRKRVDSYGVVDLNLKYAFTAGSLAYLKIDNVLDNEYIVSYRPYGARPGKDRTLILGFRQDF